MNLLTGDTVEVGYLVAAVCFVLALKGLSSPRTARRGNRVGAAGAAIALLTVFLAESSELSHVPWILLAVAVGAGIAVPAARGVRMTRMPQLVALLGGAGGGAAAVVALLVTADLTGTGRRGTEAALAFAVLVGAVSFAGSVVAFLKLQGLVTARPVILPGAAPLLAVGLVVAVGLAAGVVATANLTVGLLLGLASLILGVMIVLPVGGTDVRVVASLLGACTGLAVAAGGFVLRNPLLLVAGALVGASGTVLTRSGAAARGRSIAGVLFGALQDGPAAGPTGMPDRRDRPDLPDLPDLPDRLVTSVFPEDVAILLGYARKVVVVPGYGLAVAQAHHVVRELAEVLEAKGVEVRYGIHPAAGRMPGHLNILLAEADVPYEALAELDDINPEFTTTDVVLVVGANDVVNPAARTTPGAAVHGMPILEVGQARHVVVLKRSMRPGFAGIENELLSDPNTSVLFGDAKDSLTKILGAARTL